VEVTLRAEPPEAVLFLDDGAELPNPHRVTVTPDSKVHTVRAKAEGHGETEQVVVFDRTKEIVLRLQEERGSSAGRKAPVRKGGQPTRPATAAATQPTAAPTPAAPTQEPGMPVVRKPIRTLDSDNPFAPKN
jgi:hypothetical protein